MCQLLLWLSSPMPRWEIRWIWSINQFICFHFYSGHSSLRISEASRPKIGVAMSGLLLNISLQGVKVSGARYQISRDLFVCPSSRLEVLLSSGQNEIISLQWLTEMSHHQQKVCFDCKNKIETKKFIACIKTFAVVKMRVTLRQVLAKQKVYRKEDYWQGFTLMTDMLIYKTVTLLPFL